METFNIMEEDKKHRVTASLNIQQYMDYEDWLNGLTLTQKILSEIEKKKDRGQISRASLNTDEKTVFDN